jgi:class 3 adenylate cyclase
LKQSFENEIEMIEESLFKISKLLMLCYGEAGATVVSKMIQSDSAVLDFGEEKGNKVLAIFAFCDIRNFTDATEVF